MPRQRWHFIPASWIGLLEFENREKCNPPALLPGLKLFFSGLRAPTLAVHNPKTVPKSRKKNELKLLRKFPRWDPPRKKSVVEKGKKSSGKGIFQTLEDGSGGRE
jgi:hypothetical protein